MSAQPTFRFQRRALTDPRIKRLARIVHLKHRECLGTLLFVWDAVYETRRAELDTATIDGCAEIDGFAQAMGDVGLAEELPEGLWRICGAAEQLAFKGRQAVKGQKGGERKAHNRRVARATPGLQHGLARGSSLDQRSETDLRDPDQRACGEVEVNPAQVSELYGALQAARSRIGIAIGAEVPRLASTTRIQLLELLERDKPTPAELDAALAELEQRARLRRRLDLAGVDELALLVIDARKGPKRAELRVVRDDQVVEREGAV